ncbi:MAG TPA: hypothetical protein VMS31_13330, partial [Pyrinomonadaceae bacterium]|nr:hypothetical protein [Pyrinomonadaceae bacterium]
MAEDLPAEEILKQLIERLDLLERVLATNTARLHGIEKQLGIEHRQRRLTEPFATGEGTPDAPASQSKTPVDERPGQTTPPPQPIEQPWVQFETKPSQPIETPPSPASQLSPASQPPASPSGRS